MTKKPTSIVSASAALSLTDLNFLIAQQEALIGPVTAIGNDGTATLLTLDRYAGPPAQNARVIVKEGATIPPGSVSVAEGTVFIAGEKTAVIAVRP